jgi:hypothetical protein
MFENLNNINYKLILPCVVVKIMGDEEFCQCCSQRHNCGEIYGKLADAKGPSVTLSVVIAFLAPLVVFVVSLAVVEKSVGCVTKIVELRTGVGLAVAVTVTFVWVLIARVINRRLNRN